MMAMQMYITISEEDRIARYEVDEGTGELAHVGDTATGARPAPLAVSPAGDRLYVGCRDAIAISSYAIGEGGELAHIGDAAVDNDPCYLATDRSGRFLLSAYYEGGRCAVHAIGDDGAAVAPPVEWLATDKGAHSMQTDASNRFAFVPHISGGNGPNAIYQFRFDAETGHITPNTPARVEPGRRAGAAAFLLSSEQGYSVFLGRTGMQRYGVQLRRGERDAERVSDCIDAAAGIRRAQQLFADTDCAVG